MPSELTAPSGAVPASGGLNAWVDESMRITAEGGMYILAAAVCDVTACDGVRDQLRTLLLRRQDRLHWRDESALRRTAIAQVIAELALTSTVVVGIPLDRRRQERARRLCMETLYPHLVGSGVTTIWQEARTRSLDDADRRMVDALRGKGVLPSSVAVEFARPREEPLLWVPDAVAGAMGGARSGESPVWWLRIASRVTEIDIELR